MAEGKSFFEMSPKQGIVMGLALGIAVVSLVGFFALLVKSEPTDNVEGEVAGNVNTNVNSAPTPTPTPEPAAADLSKLSGVLKDAQSEGPEDAKVTLIEVSDFQCPYCSRHALTLDQIMKDYAGKVRKIWINFPLTSIHPNAQKAAEAAECAGEEGKFWEMHDKIFANQSALAVDNLKTYAKDLGLNTSKFNSCLDDSKYASKIQQQSQAAQAAGITGTPGTFVNGELVKGAYPYDTFKQLIDAELGN